MKVSIPSVPEMLRFGEHCGKSAEPGDLLALSGQVGAGKTTFARGFGKALNLETSVSSPTFVVARTHLRKQSHEPPLVHLDAYRLNSSAELEELDIDVANSIVIGEWASPFIQSLGSSWLEISIARPVAGLGSPDEEELREIVITSHGHNSNLFDRVGRVAREFNVLGN